MDVLFMAVAAAFFILCWGLVELADRLTGG